MGKKSLVLCDTNILIEFYKGNAAITDSLKNIGQQNIAVSIISSGELIYGALNKRELVQIKKDVSHLRLLPIDERICEKFYDLMLCYSLSHKISLPDAFIAATALVYNIKLYTLNLKDFRYIEGLELYKD